MAEQTITTAVVGQASAPPDAVDLQFSATAEESDVTNARRAVAEQATQLRQVLYETSIPAEQLRMSRFQIKQRPPD